MRKLRLWVPVGLYCGAIFILSSLERLPEVPGMLPDKRGHLILFAGLGWLTARAVSGHFRLVRNGMWLVCALFCLAYGLTDELHQSFVPGRTSEAGDVLADFFGGLVGAYAYTSAARRLRMGKPALNTPKEAESFSDTLSSSPHPLPRMKMTAPAKLPDSCTRHIFAIYTVSLAGTGEL